MKKIDLVGSESRTLKMTGGAGIAGVDRAFGVREVDAQRDKEKDQQEK